MFLLSLAVQQQSALNQVLRIQNPTSLSQLFSSCVHVNFIFNVFISTDAGLCVLRCSQRERKTSGSLVVEGARNNREVWGVPLCGRQRAPHNRVTFSGCTGPPSASCQNPWSHTCSLWRMDQSRLNGSLEEGGGQARLWLMLSRTEFLWNKTKASPWYSQRSLWPELKECSAITPIALSQAELQSEFDTFLNGLARDVYSILSCLWHYRKCSRARLPQKP